MPIVELTGETNVVFETSVGIIHRIDANPKAIENLLLAEGSVIAGLLLIVGVAVLVASL